MRKITFGIFKLLVFIFLHLILAAVNGQISITSSTPVTENFDAMGTTATASLPSGWKMSMAGAGSPLWSAMGNFTSTTQSASGGTPTTGGRYNWGNESNTADRAIGFMTSNGYSSPNSIMAQYVNNSSSVINGITVAYSAERYRINSAALSIQFFYSVDGNIWNSVSSGNLSTTSFPASASSTYDFNPAGTPTNTNPGLVSLSGISITGLSIPLNSNLYLRWEINTTGANSQGVGIDNVSVTAYFAQPSVVSPSVSNITENTAILGATILNQGSSAISERGTVFKTSPGTAITDNKKIEGGTSLGAFSDTRTSLSPETKYYFRGYATNSFGTTLSVESSFYTLSTAPLSQPINFNASPVTTTKIQLDWDTLAFFPSTGATSFGFLILRRSDGTNPGPSGISNGTATFSLPSGTTLVTTIMTAGTFTYANSGLTPGMQYNYTIIPFTWDGINPETRQYLVNLPASTVALTPATVATGSYYRSFASGNWTNVSTYCSILAIKVFFSLMPNQFLHVN